jgi:putative hydrolase of the HAD superfamily
VPAERVKAVLLDAGGVLLLPDPAELRRGFEPLGLAPDDDACWRAHYASMRELDRIGWSDWPAVDRVLAREVGVAPEHVEAALPVIERVYQHVPFVPVPGALDGLRALQDAGYSLAIVSNATGTMEQQLATHRICAVGGGGDGGGDAVEVAIVVDSHTVGVEKPDPRIFTFALDALGVGPEDCVFVGDTVALDVRGAEAAGITPLHLDPYGFCDEADHDHVTSLTDVVELLQTRSAGLSDAVTDAETCRTGGACGCC